MHLSRTLRRAISVLGLPLLLACPDVRAQELDPLEDALSSLLSEQQELVEQRDLGERRVDFSRQVERTANNVFVITREQIEAVNPRHPAEMLRYVPGFTVLRRQELSYEISAFGTGGQLSNKVLILVDGHRVSDPNFGNTFWHLVPLVQDDLDRIEVVLGPEATVYGSNAFAAVVDFITRDPGAKENRVTTRTGTNSYHQVNWTSTSQSERGQTRLLVSSEHRGSAGGYKFFPGEQLHPVFSSVDGYTQTMARVSHQRDLDPDTRLQFSVGMTSSDSFGVIPAAFLAQRLLGGTSDNALLTFDLDHSISTSRQVSLRGTYSRTHIRVSAPPLGQFAVNEIEHDDFQGELDLRYRWEPKNWHLTAGLNHRSLGVAGPYNEPVDSLQHESVFFLGEREFGEKFVLFLGARAIFLEDSEDVTAWKSSGLYRPRRDLGFRLSVGTSFREPDMVGTFFRNLTNLQMGPATLPLSAPMTISNPALESESSKAFVQFGVEKVWARDRVKLDFYRYRYEGMILGNRTGIPVTVFVPPGGPTLPVGNQFQLQNLLPQDVRGVTLAYQRELGADFQLQVALNAQNLENPNATVENAYAPPRSGSLLLSRPAEGNALGGSLSIQAVDHYGASGNYETSGYTTVDLNLERRMNPRTSALLTVRNLFDREHLEVGDTNVGDLQRTKGIEWGRETYLSLRFDL